MNDDSNLTDQHSLSGEDLSILGLREQPFTDHAEEAYLYSDSQLDMTANIIMEYLTNPATTIVLIGENGLGKTTFLRKVLRLGYQQYQFCTLRANTETDFPDVESKIKQRWVLDENGSRSPVADLSIENYVITYLREHTHAVLIIDDAHLLDSATLDRLFTLKHRIGLACPAGLGFILAGENTLKSTVAELEDSNPACTQMYQINVRPFSHSQTKSYIEFRLGVAGLEDDVLLDEAKITEIYKNTTGNVRQIHNQSNIALKQQCNEEPMGEYLDPPLAAAQSKPKVPVLFLTLLAIISLGMYINFKQGNNAQQEVTIPLETPRNSEPTLSPLAQEINRPDDEQTPSLPLPNAPAMTSKAVSIADIANLDINKKSVPPAKNLPSLLAESIESTAETQATLSDNTTSDAQPEVSPDQNNVTSTSNVEDTPDIPAVEDTPPTATTTQTATPRQPSYGKKWLSSLPTSHYTLQVVATKERKQLQALVKQEKLTTEYALFRKAVNGETYHVLVMGNYKDRNTAITAASKLPASLRKNKPWPVSVKKIEPHLK